MKTLNLITVLVILAGMVSCSPKISTVNTKHYPSREADTKVFVYFNQQEVPPQTEAIGKVHIGDSGFTSKCDSLTVFSLAENETRKAGGNGLLITEYRRPSVWSGSCHQIEGTMLNVINFDSTSSSSQSQEKFDYKTVTMPKPARVAPLMVFEVNGGFAWRTAKISDALNEFQREFVRGLKSGYSWNVGVSYYFNDHWGIKMNVYQFSASNSMYGSDTQTGLVDILEGKDRITYIGPSCTYRAPFSNNKWFFYVEMGLGYIGYKETLNIFDINTITTGSSVGFKTTLGLDYKFAKNWGLGVNIGTMSGTISNLNINTNGNKRSVSLDSPEGLGQVSTMIGLRYYIK